MERLTVRRWPPASVVGPLFGTWAAARSLASVVATTPMLAAGAPSGQASGPASGRPRGVRALPDEVARCVEAARRVGAGEI